MLKCACLWTADCIMLLFPPVGLSEHVLLSFVALWYLNYYFWAFAGQMQ